MILRLIIQISTILNLLVRECLNRIIVLRVLLEDRLEHLVLLFVLSQIVDRAPLVLFQSFEVLGQAIVSRTRGGLITLS